MLVLMTLFALFLGYHLNWIHQRRELIKSGVVTIDTGLGGEASPPVMLGLFGEPAYRQLIVDVRADSPEFRHIKGLFPEANCCGIIPFPGTTIAP